MEEYSWVLIYDHFMWIV